MTLAVVCAGESRPSLVCDQQPTTHAVQVNFMLFNKGQHTYSLILEVSMRYPNNYTEAMLQNLQLKKILHNFYKGVLS
jgi:hypothetical protein